MDDLTAALKVYLGRPSSPYPRDRLGEVEKAFGEQTASQVAQVMAEVSGLEVDWKSHSLLSAMRWVQAEMRHRVPALSSEAINDLGWAWSYWKK